MNRRRLSAGIALGAAVILASVGCGGPGVAASPAVTAVAVTLQEWAVGTTPNTARAGTVNFTVANVGPNDTHEFVVIKTDLSLIALPTEPNGAVSETGAGMTVVDEIEDIPVGGTENLSVALTAGAYVLICNIYDETEQESHYQEGMRTSFTVTQ
jgi:uncharacterized cupredoxin-like copper-binding protein